MLLSLLSWEEVGNSLGREILYSFPNAGRPPSVNTDIVVWLKIECRLWGTVTIV